MTSTPTSVDILAPMFRALGDPTRLRILLFLRDRCCPVAIDDSGEVRPVRGATVGEVCCHVTGREGISSNVSFHLKELRQAGLIRTERHGRFILCAIDPDAVHTLAASLVIPASPQDGCARDCESEPPGSTGNRR